MKTLSEHWRDRLEAEGWKSESLILLARLMAEMVEHAASGGLTPAGERMLSEQQPTPFDWAKAYRAAPTFLARIVTHVDPSITPLPPSDDQLFATWLRTILEKVDRLVRRLAHRTDPTSGLLL